MYENDTRLTLTLIALPKHEQSENQPKKYSCHSNTGSSCLMRISLLRISLLRFFKTITKIWLMRFYGLFILLLRT